MNASLTVRVYSTVQTTGYTQERDGQIRLGQRNSKAACTVMEKHI